jgi:hypothetical protein
MTDLAYPKCPVCGSTDAQCYLLGLKGWYPLRGNKWHRERKIYDPRLVRCDACGADIGEPCRTSNDNYASKEHAARCKTHRAALLSNYARYDNVGF